MISFYYMPVGSPKTQSGRHNQVAWLWLSIIDISDLEIYTFPMTKNRLEAYMHASSLFVLVGQQGYPPMVGDFWLYHRLQMPVANAQLLR